MKIELVDSVLKVSDILINQNGIGTGDIVDLCEVTYDGYRTKSAKVQLWVLWTPTHEWLHIRVLYEAKLQNR